MKRIGLLLFAVLAACVALANDKGDALIKEIEAIKTPEWIQAKQDDQAYVKKYLDDLAAATKKKNDLILDLYKADPNNPRTAPLMKERWQRFETGNIGEAEAYAKRISDDIDAILKTNPPAAVIEAAETARVTVKVRFSYGKDVLPDIEAFIKKYPKSEDAPILLIEASYDVPKDKKSTYFHRFIELFPNDKRAPMIKGALRQEDAIGKPFELKFTDAITGEKYDIADKKGKVVVIDFWATWCGPCVAKMPEVKKLLDKYGPQGMEVVGVSLDQPESEGGLKALKEFVAKNKYPWAQYYQGNGWDSEFSSGWGIMSIPNVFVIDKKGNLREVAVLQLEQTVIKLLAEKD